MGNLIRFPKKNPRTPRLSQKGLRLGILYGLAVAVVSSMVACSNVHFSNEPLAACQGTDKSCVRINGYDQFDYTVLVGGGQVDILFVDDNSGSMSFEQEKIGQRFPNLFQKLDARMLDYRIGITTTDISSADNGPRGINGNGALQDGKLIDFGSGTSFLEPNTANKAQLFQTTIKRPETIECEAYINQAITANTSQSDPAYRAGYNDHCPSGDERGIYAMNLVISNNPSSFIRPKSHLAIVVISDENERSFGNTDAGNSYALEAQDLPQSVVDNVKSKFSGDKTLGVHSLVVKSSDTACLAAQNAQMSNWVKGFYGTQYEALATLTGGVVGSVCANDYGEQMGTIGSAIVKQVESLVIACDNPKDLKISVNPGVGPISWTQTKNVIKFAQTLPVETKAHLIYGCPVFQ